MEMVMKIGILPIVMAAAVLSGAAFAQTQQPYAGLQTRAIKALSEQQIDDLKSGRGMGLALAAELNGYPGPMHVLELADGLKLSPAQREKMRDLLSAMKEEAIFLGTKLIAEEADLDRQFASKTVTPASLAIAMQTIGATQASLRAAHLKYHLSTLDVLEPSQVQSYIHLRGNSGDQQPRHDHGGRRH
jgi:hypothetical protein